MLNASLNKIFSSFSLYNICTCFILQINIENSSKQENINIVDILFNDKIYNTFIKLYQNIT